MACQNAFKNCKSSTSTKPIQHMGQARSEEHTSELQSQSNLVCRLLLEKKKNTLYTTYVTVGVSNRNLRDYDAHHIHSPFLVHVISALAHVGRHIEYTLVALRDTCDRFL